MKRDFFLSNLMRNNGIIFFTDQEMIVMKKAYLTLLAVLTNILLFAQEKTTQVAVDVNKSTSTSISISTSVLCCVD